MLISLDYTNMMKDAIGPESGVQDEELAELSVQTKAIHQLIQNRRDAGDLPFFDQPNDQAMIAEVLSLLPKRSRSSSTISWCSVSAAQLSVQRLSLTRSVTGTT